MSEIAPAAAKAPELPLPRSVPALLSFVAGYIDIYTFLALFGLFVAQVTGSFVTAGAELVSHDVGITGKVIAIVAFLVAAALTAGLIALARDRDRPVLPWMLGFETLLLAAFTVDWGAILAGALGAMAMGAQSALVRLLMRGIPQTNVMTGNMTQLGIETTELIIAWRRHARDRDDLSSEREFLAVRSRLLVVLSIATGFLLGAAAGAVGYAKAGLAGIPLAVLIVASLAVWALVRERRA
jgi:uncharacterized membrane protein YoaK (UPF0700 family)